MFIVGTGPSLNNVNLDLIAGRESWSMNRIHLIYPRTKWRPTKWLWCDRTSQKAALLYEEAAMVHINPKRYECYIWDGLRETMDWRYECAAYGEHVRYFPICFSHTSMDIESPGHPTSWHLPDRSPRVLDELIGSGQLCKWGSGIFIWLQAAIWMHMSPIYLLGCDLYYTKPDDVADPNHFDPKYTSVADCHNPVLEPTRKNRTLIAGHEMTLALAKSEGVEIFNATPGGQLEVYPRISFEEAVRCP